MNKIKDFIIENKTKVLTVTAIVVGITVGAIIVKKCTGTSVIEEIVEVVDDFQE